MKIYVLNSDRSQSDGAKCPVRPIGGFTLVELLVVISIIALLLSIMMPALQGARAAALKVVCASNMKQMFLATKLYADDNGGYLPNCYAGSYGEINPRRNWFDLIYQYMQGKKLKWDNAIGRDYKLYHCPAGKKDEVWWANYTGGNQDAVRGYGNYAYNSTLGPGQWSSDVVVGPAGGGKLSQLNLESPARTFMYIDSRNSSGIDYALEFGYIENYPRSMVRVSYRHSSSANIILCDGHTDSIKVTNKQRIINNLFTRPYFPYFKDDHR